MNRGPLKNFRVIWLGLSLPAKGFAMLFLPMLLLCTALALLHVSSSVADNTNRVEILTAAKSLITLGLLGAAIAMAIFTRGVGHRLQVIEESARCLRFEQPLTTLAMGDDEVGRVEKQLEITSELLFTRLSGLRENEERLQAILDQTTAVIYVKDFEGRYLFTNKHYEEVFGISKKDACGRTDAEVFPKQIASKFRENDLRVIKLGRSVEFEEIAPHRDGLHTYLSLKFPLLDANKKPVAVAGISTDISHRKRLEEALRRVNEELSRQTEKPSWEASPPVDFGSPPEGWISGFLHDRPERPFSVTG